MEDGERAGEDSGPKEEESSKTVLNLARENRRVAFQIRELLQPSKEPTEKKAEPMPKHLLFEVQDIIEESSTVLREVRTWLKALGK